MTESARYLRWLGALGCGLALYCLLMTGVSRAGQGILLSIHGAVATSVGVVVAVRRTRGGDGRWTALVAALIWVAWGLAELGWASSFFLSQKSHRALQVVLATESGYFIAFLLSIVCMLSAIEGRLRAFLSRSVVLIPLVLTSPIAFRLILHPFLTNRDAGLTAFNLGETTAIAVSYVALNVALLVLLSTRSIDWSIFAAGVLCLVFGDWSVRLDKITGQPIEVGLGSFFILSGLYAAALPLGSRRPLGRIQPFESTSILNSYRAGLLAVALSMVLVFALYQSDGVRTLRILCLGSGAATFVAVFLSQLLVERVQAVSTQIGRVLRSDLAQDRADAEPPEGDLPIELREIYRMAFATTVREQKLREEQRAIEQVRQVQEQVAHDIRSPLAAIDAALAGSGPTPAADQRQMLERAAARIRDIAADLMPQDASERAVEPGSETAGPCFIMDLIDDVAEEKRGASQATIQIDMAEDAVARQAQVGGIAAQLKRALSNLIDNAIEAMDGRGRVTVAGRVEGTEVLITITDTGRGIAPESLAQLGKRGWTDGKRAGRGLGVYQARAAVAAAGGTLMMESTLGQGTAVHIRLPLQPTPPAALCVLVIDDDEMIAWSWRKRQRRFGVTTLHFFHSMEACEAAAIDYRAVDVAFVDWHNRGTAWPIDRAIQHLKARGVRRVFVATGSTDASTDPACLQADGITADKCPADLAPYIAAREPG